MFFLFYVKFLFISTASVLKNCCAETVEVIRVSCVNRSFGHSCFSVKSQCFLNINFHFFLFYSSIAIFIIGFECFHHFFISRHFCIWMFTFHVFKSGNCKLFYLVWIEITIIISVVLRPDFINNTVNYVFLSGWFVYSNWFCYVGRVF